MYPLLMTQPPHFKNHKYSTTGLKNYRSARFHLTLRTKITFKKSQMFYIIPKHITHFIE